MGRTLTSLARFTRGLVTDQVGVPGALLEACDVMPMDTGNGWKVRGGKGSPSVITDSTGGANAHDVSGIAVGNFGGALIGATTGGSSLWPVDSVSVGAMLLSSLPAAQYTDGLTAVGSNALLDMNYSGTMMGRELWLTSATRIPVRWAGAAGTVGTYSTGTVATTDGSYTVTGTGTTWTTSHIGCYLWINHATLGNRAYRIVGRSSNTSVTVDRPLPATVSGQSYTITNLSWWSVKPGTFGGSDGTYAPSSFASVTARGYLNAFCAAQHQGRMFAGNVVDQAPLLHFPDRVRWSAVDQETDAAFGGDGEWGGPEYWHPNAYIDVAPGKGGTGIRALAPIGSTLFVFKSAGVFAIRGYVETDGRDVGATVETVTLDTGSGHPPAVLEDVIYFAGRDGIYELTETGIRNLSVETGTQKAFLDLTASYGVVALSVVGDRVIVHTSQPYATAVAADVPNVLVFHRARRVWSQQQTIVTARALPARGTRGGKSFAMTQEVNYAGRLVDWYLDTVALSAHDANVDVLGKITTHPIPLKGGMNGRIRAAQVRARWETADAATMQLSVLLGEEGTTTAAEAAITGAAATATSGRVEQWFRIPVRGGTPPVDSARVRLTMTDRVSAGRIYEVGIEHVPVARVR